jgi:predicted negative regulator of RcsB-dependent stress response
MSKQLALDAHYKNLSENYTSNLTVLLNQSKFADALNLSDEAIKHLISPYSNIKGDIYTSMDRFEDAIESYQNAQKEFTYDNESVDYQNKVRQDFKRDWNTIVL